MDISGVSEIFVRLGFFVGVFVALAGFEAIYPRRPRLVTRLRRWPTNIGVSALNQVLTRLLIPASALAVALYCETNQLGLFNLLVLPVPLEILLAVLMLDLAIYLQHRLYHWVPLLWRFHRVHHADIDFDVTTGIRFHPVSILFSALIKLAVVFCIGASALAVLVFEVLLNATSLFNHSNLRLPSSVDRVLRLVVVTPDMHRVHHSTVDEEMNSNFGFNFPWWDRLLSSYRAQPQAGHDDMVIGLSQFREAKDLRLDRILLQPFAQADN